MLKCCAIALVLLNLIWGSACGEKADVSKGLSVDQPEFSDDLTGEVLQRILENGTDLSRPMEVDFHIHVPSKKAGKAVAELARKLDFAVSVSGDADAWTVECSRTMIASHASISRIEAQLDEIARPHGGHIDGWGTFGN